MREVCHGSTMRTQQSLPHSLYLVMVPSILIFGIEVKHFNYPNTLVARSKRNYIASNVVDIELRKTPKQLLLSYNG